MLPLLNDIRILELTVAWAGPLAGRLFADLGADVIHVEHMNARGTGFPSLEQSGDWEWGTLPDPATRSGVYPAADPGDRPWNRQAIFNKHNRNKRSLCIDLKRAEARDIFLRLAKRADVVLDNYSPHVMLSLGIGYDDLRAVNPSIICISMSGYGQTGPFADRISYGPILEAHSGLASIVGEEDAPLKLGAALPDAIGGVTAAFAMASALLHRDDTGDGQFIDLSQLETYCAIAGDALLFQSLEDEPVDAGRWADLTFGALHGTVLCSDDLWLSVSAPTEQVAERLRAVVDGEPDNEEMRDGPAKGDLVTRLEEWCGSRSRDEAFECLQSNGIPAFPALSNGELVTDEHLAARKMFVEFEQTDAGSLTWPAFPVRTLDGSDPARYQSAPALGGDNEDILIELCGMSVDEVAQLDTDGVIGKGPILV